MLSQHFIQYPFLETIVPAFVGYLIDEDGRPLAENNAPDDLRENVEFNYQPCPYHGSRREGRMNVTALKQMTSCWSETIEDLLFLRGLFMRQYPVEMNYLLLSRLANYLTFVPGFLARKRLIASGAIPRSLSGLFKSAQGLYMTSNDVIVRNGMSMAYEPVRVDAFLEHTEKHDVFRVGDNVCAAPPSLIRSFLNFAIHGGNDSPRRKWFQTTAQAVASLSYADLSLKAQMSQRVFEAWLDDELLACGFIATGHPQADEVKSINQLSGLKLDQTIFVENRFSSDQIARLLTREGATRDRDLHLCKRLALLQLHYFKYVRELQSQINQTLELGEVGHFCLSRSDQVSGNYDSSERRRILKELFDYSALALLIEEHVNEPK